MKHTISVDKEDAKGIAEQRKFEFIVDVLQSLFDLKSIDISECVPDSGKVGDRTIEQIQKLKHLMNEQNIYVHTDEEEIVSIYLQGEVMAQWGKPVYSMHHDPTQLKTNKKYYINIEFEFWSYNMEES